jgi:hypothetical protein
MSGHAPWEPSTEALGAALIAIDRARLPWHLRWLLREGGKHRSALAREVARRVEGTVGAREREETTARINASWENALAWQADAEAELPPFSGSTAATCPKCAHRNGTKDRHHAALPAGALPEFLSRACRACGFEWRERCADAPKPQNGPESPAGGTGDAEVADAGNDAQEPAEGREEANPGQSDGEDATERPAEPAAGSQTRDAPQAATDALSGLPEASGADR